MSDTNLPDEGTGGDAALSYDDGAEAISNIIDPETDLDEEDQAQTDAEVDGEAEEVEETDAEDPDADADDDEGDVDAETEDGPGEIKGGRFAPDTAKVTLDDGTVTTVGELRRNNLYQRDYTRKTQELAEERKSVETVRGQTDEFARQISAQRDFLLQAAQHFLPKPPDRSMIGVDIIGYQEALAEYEEKRGVLGQIQQMAMQEQQRQQQEAEQAQQERVQQEAQKLVEAMPELRKPEVYNKFWADAVDVMAEFGFTAEELSHNTTDHRFFKIFRALMDRRRDRQAAQKVKKDIQSRPVLRGGKRMDPKAKNSREHAARGEALRKTGDFDAGVAALMDLDL